MSAESGGPGPPKEDQDKSTLTLLSTSPNNLLTDNQNNMMECSNTNNLEMVAENSNMVIDTTNRVQRPNKRPADDTNNGKGKICVQENKHYAPQNSAIKVDYVKSAVRNRYRVTDKGPYIINLEGNKGNLGKVHRMALGKWLFQSASTLKNEIIDIMATGKNRMKMTTKTPEAANELLSLEIFREREITAYIPNFRVFSTGIIRDIDIYLSDEEILNELNSPIAPTSVRRLTRKNIVDNKTLHEKLPVCIISFDSQSLPEIVTLYGARCRVEPYIPPLRQCRNCLRFRHSEDQCRSKARCDHCSGDHNVKECPVHEAIMPVCVHCNGEHRSSFRECPVRMAHINSTKTKNNKPSFATVTKNKFEILSEYQDEFPAIDETTTKIIRKPKQQRQKTPQKANKSEKINNKGVFEFPDNNYLHEAAGREHGKNTSVTESDALEFRKRNLKQRINPNEKIIQHLIELIQKVNSEKQLDLEIIFKSLGSKLEEILQQNQTQAKPDTGQRASTPINSTTVYNSCLPVNNNNIT